jgi:glyoxylase-like metal-dependent hydrolase (beta-lactamase superfamily II)
VPQLFFILAISAWRPQKRDVLWKLIWLVCQRLTSFDLNQFGFKVEYAQFALKRACRLQKEKLLGRPQMTTFTRRSMLSAAAGATAMAVSPFEISVSAATPPAGKQTAGWYRYKVGTLEITVATDGIARFKMAEDHVTNIKLDTVNAALAEVFMEKDTMTTPYNPVAVNTGSKLLVIDTGTGEANYHKTKGVGGQFVTNLAAAGIERSAVDVVIISHYHGDHINGLLMADNSLTYPNAEILVPATEHKFWMDDGEMSRASAGRVATNFKNVRRVFNAEVLKRVRTYEWGKDVVPGITAQGTPGHTPGHTSYVIASGSEQVYLQSDVTHVPFLFVRHPDWHAFYDQDGAMAEVTRRKVYDMLAAEKMRVQGFHYPFPSLAHVEKDGSGYRYFPVPWNPTI